MTSILYVDENRYVLECRKPTLESCGYRVIGVASVRAALDTLENDSVDVVLVEYKTEGLDAEAVAYHIKQGRPDLPIIVLSAFSDIPECIVAGG